MSAPPPPGRPARRKHSTLTLIIDYAPVVAFFIAYRLFRPAAPTAGVAEVVAVTKSTGVFIVATLLAVAASRIWLGRVAPMLWITAILVCGFGALTVWSQNESWIRHKPTAVYILFAVVLAIGWWRGRPTLKYLLESAFEGLDDSGWMMLTRNWAAFFLFLAALNEVFAHHGWVWHGVTYFTFDQWLRAKLLVFVPLSFLFTFAHMPMLLRHGLGSDTPD